MGEHRGADQRMPLDLGPLQRIELAGLGQDVCGHGDLPDVVEQCRAAQRHDPLAVQAELLADRHGVGGHVLGVVARGQLARVDRRHHRVEVGEDAVGTAGALVGRDLAGHGAQVLPVPLGPVQRGVGPLLQLLARARVLGTRGHTAGECDAPVRQHRAARDRRAQALRDEQGVELLGLWEQQRELLAADAGQRVGRPQQSLPDSRDLAQHVVARGVAVAVVDRLEVVDVEERE